MTSVADDAWLAIALSEAEAAAARGEVPVGAVIVSMEGAELARAGNRIVEDKDATAHAELLALRAAGQGLGNEPLIGTTLYVTLEPFAMCAGAITLARVTGLVYAAPDAKGGAVEHGPRFLEQPTGCHRPIVARVREGTSSDA